MIKKLKFRSVVSLVIGSQIGSGVFLLPASLAILGPISLFSWLISGSGAILLALVFANLSMRISKAGGPHVYVEKAFGRKAAFFTAWTYWLVSWVSSIAVIIAAVGYLAPLVGITDPWTLLVLKIAIFSSITALNIKGAALAGSFEFFLTLLKCIPLLIIPIACLFFLKMEYFSPINPGNLKILSTLNVASLLTFWGFVGIESATTAGGIIDNPTKTIPRAVVMGTLIVAIIYFFNSFGIMGVVAPDVLASSSAPYVDAADKLFGRGGNIAIAIIAFTACIGTLNAWVLTSGQIAAQASKDGLFPPLFSKSNKAGSPYMSILIAFFCTLILLIVTCKASILTQINTVIDVSVTAFIVIYLACAASLLKILLQENKKSLKHLIICILSIIFCLWILAFNSLFNLLLCSLLVLMGLPIYIKQYKKI